MTRIVRSSFLASLAVLLAFPAAAAAAPHQTADILGPPDPASGSRPLVVVDGATLIRGTRGLSASISMPTPAPGSYAYPEGPTASGVPGHPEAFSLWVFVFFNPEACIGPCDGADLTTNDAVVAGAFNAGGHLVGGPHLTIAGRISEQSTVFPPQGSNPLVENLSQALALGYTIADAEVHLAVAPHGALDPHLLPAQITTPVGNAGFWWVAIYE
jgi:hypothetical protein